MATQTFRPLRPIQSWATALALLAAGLALFALTARPAAAQERIELDYFVEALEPYGEWVDHPRHGRAWYPRDVPYDWRPYTVGRWENTEEHGWTWVSDEEWGWAPYHYGRWDFDDRFGWIWVPGQDWAPAWVEWRSGDGYIGWAPLPPAAVWRGDRIIYDNRFDFESPRARRTWVFVQQENFLRPRIYTHCEPPARNITIVGRTRGITNYTIVNRGIFNRSLEIDFVRRVTRQPVIPLRIERVSRPDDRTFIGPDRRPPGGTLTIFRPDRNTPQPDRRPGVGGDRVRPNVPLVPPTGRTTTGRRPEGEGEGDRTRPIQPGITPPPTRQPDRGIDELQRRQQADREELQRRQREERQRATLPQTPTVIQRQVRERVEQQRIEQQQRTVVQSRPVPPQVPSRQPVQQPPPQRTNLPPPQQQGSGKPPEKKPAQPGQEQQQRPR